MRSILYANLVVHVSLLVAPSAGIPFGSDKNIAGKLERDAIDLFEGMHSLPIVMKRDAGNVEVRVKSDGDRIMTFGEAKEVDLHPNAFKKFLHRFKDEFPKVNPMVLMVKPLEKDRFHGGREGVKSILKFPFPLSNRLMIHWKYLKLDRASNEHMLLLSEEGNEHLLKKYLSEKERKKFVLARTFLCAYWIRPIYEKNSKNVVGSKVQYLFCGDTGGNVPKSIQNMVGPQAACDSVQGLIKHVKKQHKPLKTK